MSPHRQKKLNNKKQSVVKIAQMKINRKIKNENNKVINKCFWLEEKIQIPQKQTTTKNTITLALSKF